jgi:hypothetical protein
MLVIVRLMFFDGSVNNIVPYNVSAGVPMIRSDRWNSR